MQKKTNYRYELTIDDFSKKTPIMSNAPQLVSSIEKGEKCKQIFLTRHILSIN